MALEVQIKRCCVLNCSTQRTGKNDVSKIAMHKLPKASNLANNDPKKTQDDLRARWLLLSGREEKDITAENEYVCGKHFLPNAYHHLDGDNKKLRKLNQNAEPSVFLPVSKEDTAGKKVASSSSTESEDLAGSSRASLNSEENEMSCEVLPSVEPDEIPPVDASIEADAGNSKDSTEAEFFEFESVEKAEKNDKVEKTTKTVGNRRSHLARKARKSSPESEVSDSEKKNGPPKMKDCLSEAIVDGSPEGEDSNETPNGSTSDESNGAKSSAKVARVIPAPKNKSSNAQKNQLPRTNGESSRDINGVGNAPACKRRFCEDSDEGSSSDSRRKKITDEQKSQARMKFSPRRSDLQSDAGAINRPDIVAGARNKQAYLKGYTEALLNEALRHLRTASETQSAHMARILEQLTKSSDEIESRYRDVACKLSSCKRSDSTRSVGIQMASLSSSLPSMSAEIPRQPSTNVANPQIPSAVAIAQPMLAPSRRGRPPANARATGQIVRPPALAEPVIDLTDDQPSISLVRAPNPSKVLNNFGTQIDSRLPATSPKALASYSRFLSATPSKATSSLPIATATPVNSSSAVSMSNSPTKLVATSPGVSPSFAAKFPNTSPSSSSSVLPASAAPQPVPVGSIFSGKLITNRAAAVRPPPSQMVSPTTATSSIKNQVNVFGTTYRFPPGLEAQPVAKNAVASSRPAASTEQQAKPQQHQPQQQQQQQQQQPTTKSRLSSTRARHPAPLPETPSYDNIGQLLTPPAPRVEVKANDTGIVLTWDMQLETNLRYSPADRFQIFTYTEGEQPPSTDLWRNIGTINALRLPMAVTLSSYKPGHRYFFAVRGVDRLNRYGAFNEPKVVDLRESIVL